MRIGVERWVMTAAKGRGMSCSGMSVVVVEAVMMVAAPRGTLRTVPCCGIMGGGRFVVVLVVPRGSWARSLQVEMTASFKIQSAFFSSPKKCFFSA